MRASLPSARRPAESEGVVEILDRADRVVDAVLTPVITKEGLTREAWRVLLMLSRGGGRSMGEIAEHAAVPNPTATRVVDRLVENSQAHRRTDPDDRRRVLVHLADGGRDVVKRVSRQLKERFDSAFTELPVTEREFSAIVVQLSETVAPVGGR
ncbi:MAG TPA: MarR family transcriptional regulator [Pseudonocardia sp.]|jgi:DNA-binding MarR family transcriptional regulator